MYKLRNKTVKSEDESGACIICNSKVDLISMCGEEIETIDGETGDCIEFYQRTFNLKFPKKNKDCKYNKLCMECIDKLKMCYEFKKSSEEARYRLYEYILQWNEDVSETINNTESNNRRHKKTRKHSIEEDSNKYNEINDELFDNEPLEIKVENCIESDSDRGDIEEPNSPEYDPEIEKRTRKKAKLKNKIMEPIRIMDIIKRSKMKKHRVLKKYCKMKSGSSRNYGSDRDYDDLSDCSTNTEEIYRATGYYETDKLIQPVKLKNRPRLKIGSLECPICEEKFPDFSFTHQHFMMHYPVGLCHLCGKTTASKHGLICHLETHEEKTGEFVCEPCNKTFKTYYTLRGHIKYTHKGAKAVKCYHCPMEFSLSLSRRIHMHKVHNINCKFHQCNKCTLKFYSKSKLRYHEDRVHARKVNFFCDECGKGFVTKAELNDHIVYRHRDKSEQPHCEICGRTFASRKGMKQHMNIHLNIRNYKCSYCDQAFVQKPSLDCHLKKHHKMEQNVNNSINE